MHCVAGLDSLTSGQVFIGDTDLTTLDDKALTQVRRDKVGFVFQSFNLIPTLTAIENITLPMDLAGRKPDKAWLDQSSRQSASATASSTDPASCPAASSSGWPWPAPWPRSRRSSSPTSPPATSTREAGAEILAFMRRAVTDLGQTIVMVTHDPVAASYADRVVFLVDGRIVDEMVDPTAERVLDRIKSFGDA